MAKKPVKDFEKKVVKVGKIKKGPVNKTDTSFTSKKVVIRSQNFGSASSALTNTSIEEQDTIIISRIRSILPNCGHYNANMRKDATLNILKTIKELSDIQSPSLLALLDPIFVAVFRQICDEEVNVRSALLGLLSYLFESIKRENLSSFFPRWISFLNLASSHIKPDIRKDSVRFFQMSLKTQKSLLLPHLHSIIPGIIPLISQYPLRNGTVLSYDCALNMIDAYLEPFLKCNDEKQLSTPLVSYTWCPNREEDKHESLEIIRKSPFSISEDDSSTDIKPLVMSEPVLHTIISHFGGLSISHWLDHSHLLSHSTNNLHSAEYKQFQGLISLYHKLYSLAGTRSFEVFWTAMPAKIVNNNRKALEDLFLNKKK